MGMRNVKTTIHQLQARKAVIEAMQPFIADGRVTPMEMLAIFSQVVGGLVAMQSDKRLTPQMATQLVSANIESGNAEMINLMKSGHLGMLS